MKIIARVAVLTSLVVFAAGAARAAETDSTSAPKKRPRPAASAPT
jgi:hypothetical protein